MNTAELIFTFIEGILTFISPCILPLLPVYFVYLAGTSTERLPGDKAESSPMAGKGPQSQLVRNAAGFVLGFTLVFVILGAAATSLGHFLDNHRQLIRQVSGVVMILFGLHFMGIFSLKFLNAERRLKFEFKELRFFSSILFGIVFGFGWTPCLGAFLGSALMLAGNSQTVGYGILLLLVYSAGLAIPLLAAALLFNQVRSGLRWIQRHQRVINIISGMVLILAGILVFTDQMKYLGSW